MSTTSRGSRILIVDDEPNTRLVFRTALEAAGYEVAEAGDGLECLEALRAGRFDVALLDLRMPRMDGMETLRRIRAEHLGVPVIMITAHGSMPDAVEAMKLGAIDFVSKPVTPQALRGAVGELLARHAPEPEEPLDSVRGVLTRAKREINRREFDAAVALIGSIKDLDAIGMAEAHYLRGLLLELRGKAEQAQAAYRAAVAADPSYEAATIQLTRATGAADEA